MAETWALVVAILMADGSSVDVVKKVYDTQQECNHVIYEERIFNGACYPVEKIVRQNKADFAVN
ncbi:DUF1482 family protein [Enterobacter asburiae]|uniref:DUF1482 family protein n=1 Tax=Enterobacter asburiae TaxID=61645 RepID=UPI001CBB4382|nr:DUF1482 family protein [Enterobacter asburiae]UAN38015.1 DUF1482 family protein [Enterobacter asburiae]